MMYYRPAMKRSYSVQPKNPGVQYPVDLVWAAACAAQRINGAYYKEDRYDFSDEGSAPVLEFKKNRTVMQSFMDTPSNILPEDYVAGQECRAWLKGDIMFRALKNKLTDFDASTQKVQAVEEAFDTNLHRFELAVIPCLPASWKRGTARQAVDARVRMATGEHVGKVGEKQTLDIEVLSTNYSQKWNTWYATALTSDNKAVFFSFKEQLAVGAKHTIKATVKSQNNGTTQLNRVTILNSGNQTK